MDGFLDAVRDGVAWILTAAITAFAGWVGWVTRTVMTNKTRLALLEDAVGKLPKQFDKLEQTLTDMREEAGEGRERIYRHIDETRRELKQDIKDARG